MSLKKVMLSTVAVLLLAVSGCGTNTNKQDTAAVSTAPSVNTAQAESSQEVDFDSMYHGVDSLDAAKTETGFDMSVPDTVNGASGCQYYVANDNSTIRARYVDDNQATVMLISKSNQLNTASENTSGYETEKTIPVNDTPVTIYENENTAFTATWHKDSYSYEIHTDVGATEGEMLELVFEVN